MYIRTLSSTNLIFFLSMPINFSNSVSNFRLNIVIAFVQFNPSQLSFGILAKVCRITKLTKLSMYTHLDLANKTVLSYERVANVSLSQTNFAYRKTDQYFCWVNILTLVKDGKLERYNVLICVQCQIFINDINCQLWYCLNFIRFYALVIKFLSLIDVVYFCLIVKFFSERLFY